MASSPSQVVWPRPATLLATVAAAVAAASCGNAATEPVVPLVAVPEAERASLALAPPEAPAGPGAPEADPRAFASAELIARFERDCEALQPAGDTPAAADRTAGYGKVYQGTRPPPELPPPPADGTFAWVEGNAEFLDPNLVSESSGTAIASQMFETLLVTSPGNRPPVPGAAERYEVSEDGLTYTFHLREGLTWSDGTPLGAEDFRYGWLRGLSPDTASKNAQQLWFIKGARAYNDGHATDPAAVAVRAVDPRTLVVELEHPTPFFPDLVTYIAYAPIPRHAVEAHGVQWVRPEHLVVNGAYIMTEWKPRDRIVMERNPRYWNADGVAIPRTLVLMSDDEAKNLRLYESGQAHWVKPIAPDKVRRFMTDGRSDLHIDQQMCSYYYVLRTDRPPFDDARVRRALNLAIDKERLTRQVLAGFQVPATNLVPDMFRQTLGYVPPAGEAYDPAEARRLLAEAGYPDGTGLPPIEIVYNTFESHRLIAEYVQRNLKENLGVEVAVNNMEWKSLLKKTHAGDFQVARTAWCADYPDPMTFLNVFHSGSENNYPGYRNPAFDAVLERIGAETDPRRRRVLMCAAEKALNRDVPFVPFYFYTRSYLLRPFVKGFEPQYQDHHLVKDLRLEEGP